MIKSPSNIEWCFMGKNCYCIAKFGRERFKI